MSERDIQTASGAARKFAETLAPAKEKHAHEALRFARWFGEERPIADVEPLDLEAYVEKSFASAPDAADRGDALKSFLSFAHKQKLMPERLVTHVRVRKANGARSGTRTVDQRPQVQLTAEGLSALSAELETLKGQRPKIAADLHDAMADKDFRENAPLDAAREAQGQMEARIRDLEATLRNATVLSEHGGGDAAKVGSNIIISNLATGTQLTYMLVSSREAKPGAGRLSVESPVGQALVGRRTGEEVEVQAPSGTVRFRIEKVEALRVRLLR